MKVNALNKAFGFLNFVRTRQDGEGGGGGNFYSKNGSGSQKQQGESPESGTGDPAVVDVTDAAVSAAVDAFATDSQAKASGLTASLEGVGPGLRVTLKDVNGAIIRKFSGEDFLKLRKATAVDRRPSGKILDQKL